MVYNTQETKQYSITSGDGEGQPGNLDKLDAICESYGYGTFDPKNQPLSVYSSNDFPLDGDGPLKHATLKGDYSLFSASTGEPMLENLGGGQYLNWPGATYESSETSLTWEEGRNGDYALPKATLEGK